MSNNSADPSPIGPSTSAIVTARVPIERAWDRFVPVELPKVFPRAKGPIPRVVSVEDQNGRWDEPGRSRTVVLGDGSRVHEAITLSEPTGGEAPSNGQARFGYTVSGFSGPLGKLAREARGLWVFTEVPDGTRIEWTYAFMPTTTFAKPVLAFIIATFWKAYMRDGMENILAELERPER